MSVFRVALSSIAQGNLDRDPSTASAISGNDHSQLGSRMNPSIQRTIYVAGPNHTYRKLKDGDQFTDSNYWKRFAYPQVSLDQAFIEVVSDDGSVYSDVADENTFPLVYDLEVEHDSVYDENVVDILGDTGSHAVFVQIANQGGTAVKVRLNGSTNAILDIGSGETQVFNHGDLSITKLEFNNTISGGSDTTVQVLVSVKSASNS